MSTTLKRRQKYPSALKKRFRFANRRSKIKLPTRFLLGGTINDPLNLEGLNKEHDRQSVFHTLEVNHQPLKTRHPHRIDFPNVTDASDPLNLKSASSEVAEPLSSECVTNMEEAEELINGGCRNQGVLETGQMLVSENEDILNNQSQCVDSSSDTKEALFFHNDSFNLNERNQLCVVQASDCSANDCKTGALKVDIACKSSDDMTADHVPSAVDENETGMRTNSNKVTSREKIVSPAVPQHSQCRARKRRRKSALVSKETFPSANSSHKSHKKSKEKFPCGNYVAYYGYRNVDRVEDPRLQLLSKELFEGRDVLDVGCNVGMVTIAIASTCLPKRILGMDVDQRLIGLAKRNVWRHMEENSYPSCLKTAFGPIATSLVSSSECSAFPHNILFQVVCFGKCIFVFFCKTLIFCCASNFREFCK